jgi:hypothetical protein
MNISFLQTSCNYKKAVSCDRFLYTENKVLFVEDFSAVRINVVNLSFVELCPHSHILDRYIKNPCQGRCLVSQLTEREVYRANKTDKAAQVFPLQRLAKVDNCKYTKHHQRDYLLRDLQLKTAPSIQSSRPVCGNCKAIFKKRNEPADRNNLPKRNRSVF